MKSSKKEMKKRLLALLLCITMVLNGGISTFAEGSEQSGHTHTEACYTNVETKELVCKVPEEEAHMHGPSCHTENKQLTCAIEASEGHVHTDKCVGVITEAVTGNVCQPEEGAEHTHTEECVGVISEAVTGNICGLEESEGHAHGDECYTVSSELTCTVPETEGHKHVDECYHVIPAGTLVCTLAETADETQKGAPSDICKCGNPECTCETCEEGCTCETAEKDEKAEETENKEETKQPEKTEYSVEGGETTPKVSITLADAAHIPDEAVLEVDSVTLTDEEAAAIEGAAKAEGIYSENVTALDICFELEVVDEETGETTLENPQPLDGNEVNVAVALPGIEADDEVSVYHLGYETVTDENGEEAKEIKIENMDGSVNAETGAVEFATSHFSYYIFVEEGINPATVDVETAEIWEATLPELTGVYGDDVAAIANSQLGYKHSEVNVITDEEGNVTGHYSRYGAWNNTPYAEWAALFVKFCVSYAEIPADRFPVADTVADWMNLLNSEDYGMFVPATISPDEYTACVGDLLFLDSDADGTADRVAVIVEVAEDGTIKTVEELDGVVANESYAAGDTRLLGYGMMPFNMEGIEADTLEGSTGHQPDTTIEYPKVSYNKDEMDPVEDSEGLELGKTINDNGDNNDNIFELNLDAYATGKETTVKTIVPMDIMLVLDKSGSMTQAAHFLKVDKTIGLERGCTYYDYSSSGSSDFPEGQGSLSDFGLNRRIPNPITFCACDACKSASNGDGMWVKELTGKTEDGKQLYEVLGTDADIEDMQYSGEETFYETNMQATERALKLYLAQIKAQCEAYGVEHRVSIMTYGQKASSGKTKSGNSNITSGVIVNGKYTKYVDATVQMDNGTLSYDKAFMGVTSEWDAVKNSVAAYADVIYSGVGTHTEYGTHMAIGMHNVWLNSNAPKEGRKAMTILFADGAPGWGTGYYFNFANMALRYGHFIKNREDKSPIYVVGLYDDANVANAPLTVPGDYYQRSDRFFNFLSSNYEITLKSEDGEDADYYGYGEEENWKSSRMNVDDVVDSANRVSSDYFYGASSSVELAQAFAKVAETSNTSVATVTLDETTVLRDQITKYFEHECTCGATDPSKHTCIEVYTVDWDGTRFAEETEWKQVYPGTSEDLDIPTGKVGVTVDNKTINVTGFSYQDYPVVDGKAGGKKIVVKVDVETEEGFWGGNNVPTNEAPGNKDDATGAAIYSNGKVIEAFPIPEANVPLHLDVEALDKTIYYGGEITADDLFGKITAGYKTTAGESYLENGTETAVTKDDELEVIINAEGKFVPKNPEDAWMADFANVSWAKGSETLDSHIENKSGSGRGYEFSLVMTPKKDGTANLSGNTNPVDQALAGTKVESGGLTSKDKGYTYILLPEVEFEDSVINFGMIPTDQYYHDTNKMTADGAEAWVIDGLFTEESAEGDDDPTTYPAVSGEKPALSYTYTPVGNYSEDTPVNVTVTSDNIDGVVGDITSVTTFKWQCDVTDKPLYHDEDENIVTPHKGNTSDYEFWIHLLDPYELPATGGWGTYWYTLGGVVLMMGTSLMIYKKKREEVLGAK